MIARAEAKGDYDRLAVGNLAAFLSAEIAKAAKYDLVLAADVFVYVNDLAAVLADVARVLAPRGMLAFTVETHSAPALRCCRHCASPTASSICAMRSPARA